MTDQQLLQILSQILSDVLGGASVELAMDTRRVDVEGWDSFSYINFIVAVEQRLSMKFGLAEIESFENVGAIVKEIQRLGSR